MILGHQTTGTLSSATRNTAVGIQAMDAITTGDNNTAIGYNTIGVRGYKGQVASLFGKPVLLFDDIEKNIELLRHRSSCQCPLDGVVVRRGSKARWSVRRGFFSSSDPTEWFDIMRYFNLTRRVPEVGSDVRH